MEYHHGLNGRSLLKKNLKVLQPKYCAQLGWLVVNTQGRVMHIQGELQSQTELKMGGNVLKLLLYACVQHLMFNT
jgi:hypothetical protein